jgi:hypothetical protein
VGPARDVERQALGRRLERVHGRSSKASWANYTVFDRARAVLSVVGVRELTIEDDSVAAAADFLGLRR